MFRPRKHILILFVLGALFVPPTAGAQPEPDDVSVALTSFSPWTAPDVPLSVALNVTNRGGTPLDEVAVILTIRERVRSRSAIRVALDREPGGDPLAVTTEDLDGPLEPGATASVTVQRDLGSLATAFLSERGGSGVYPLTILVKAGERNVAERSGAFVFLATPPESQLNLVWVMPIHHPANSADAQGVYDRERLRRELLEGGSLRRTVEMLERHPTAALTLAPTGLLAEHLSDVSDGFVARGDDGVRTPLPATDPIAIAAGELLGRLRTALASPAFEIATVPYARADITSLVAANMTIDAVEQVSTGRSVVGELLGREPNTELLVNGDYRADARSSATIAALGARTIVLDPSLLRDAPVSRFGNPDRPAEIRATGHSFEALFVDGPARERLQSVTKESDPVLVAMGVLAEVAVHYFEAPGVARARTFVLASNTTPSPAVAGPLLDALAQSPWAVMRAATSATADLELQSSGESLRLRTITLRASEVRMAPARAARQTVDVFERVVQAPDELKRLNQSIFISESADLRPSLAAPYAAAVRRSAESTLAAITVPPRRVTLTANGGSVPVTVVNKTGKPVRVRLRLDSAKVAFPKGATRRVDIDPAQGLQTVTFDLEARAAGSFPITVVIETPDGQDVIGSGRLLVRSTAVSAVAFAATAGGALFLLGAWARRALVRRPKANANG